MRRMIKRFANGCDPRRGIVGAGLVPARVFERSQSIANYIIEGFEYPGGLELLATVHWITQGNAEAKEDLKAAIKDVHEWSEHKRKNFSAEHIEIAWHRLKDPGWF